MKQFIFTLLIVMPLAVSAQQRTRLAPTLPKTIEGRPDFQGMWTNATLTPLERPPTLADRATLTEAEAAKYAKDFLDTNNIDRRDGGAQADVQRAYPDYFLDRGTELITLNNERRTSLIIDPPDGKIPRTVEGSRRAGARPGGGDVSNNYDDPEARPLAERCLLAFGSSSGPPMLPVLYNNHYQFVQNKDYLMIQVEMVHDARIIPLDGRSHPAPSVKKWMGDSVGHWEGDTLVVDTTNFADQISFRGSTSKLHVVERFTRIDPKTIIYRFTVDDPAAFSRPFTGEYPMRATDELMYEYACHEGNHALGDILSGARFLERQPASK